MHRITRFLATLTAGMSASAPVAMPPPLHQGRIFTNADSSRCLTGGPIGTVLSTRPCRDGAPGQEWFQASTGTFYNGENCFRAEGAIVRVAACNGADPAQQWWFVEEIRSGRDGLCLTEEKVAPSGYGKVRLRSCTFKVNQKWVSAS
jgi:hypothetical protein